jgi:DNA (cytosine-5)-methyltransferase 1
MFDLFNQESVFEKKYGTQSLPKPPFTFAEINANIGGMRLAFEKLSGQAVWASENDRFAQLTYTANFNQKPDANLAKLETLENADILTAQLQPNLADFHAFAKILKIKNNVSFLIETNKNLFLNRSKLWQTIQTKLIECNFDIFYAVLDAAKFGVPQYRKSCYIIGFRCDFFAARPSFNFPKGQTKKVYIKDILEDNIEGYAVSEHFQEFHLFHNETAQVVDNQSKIIAKPLISSYHKVQPLVGTFVKDAETGVRLLSENECKALMGFYRDFMFPVSRTQMYRELGSSVVVTVVEAIGEEVFKIMTSSG